jgi:predicted alpha/beta hydrolase family esterase
VSTVRRVVNAIHGIGCALIGHRWKQQQGQIAGFTVVSAKRCTRCEALALCPFHAGSEEYR